MLERAAFDRTTAIAVRFGVLARLPSPAAIRTDLAQAALAGISEDARGIGWQQPVVPLMPAEP